MNTTITIIDPTEIDLLPLGIYNPLMLNSERREVLRSALFAMTTGISAIGAVIFDRANRNFDRCASDTSEAGYTDQSDLKSQCGPYLRELTVGAFVWLTGSTFALKDPDSLSFRTNRRDFLKRLIVIGAANATTLAIENQSHG